MVAAAFLSFRTGLAKRDLFLLQLSYEEAVAVVNIRVKPSALLESTEPRQTHLRDYIDQMEFWVALQELLHNHLVFFNCYAAGRVRQKPTRFDFVSAVAYHHPLDISHLLNALGRQPPFSCGKLRKHTCAGARRIQNNNI